MDDQKRNVVELIARCIETFYDLSLFLKRLWTVLAAGGRKNLSQEKLDRAVELHRESRNSFD